MELACIVWGTNVGHQKFCFPWKSVPSLDGSCIEDLVKLGWPKVCGRCTQHGAEGCNK
jgi:hypothetical protein